MGCSRYHDHAGRGCIGQAQRQPTRGPLRNQGGVPLKKARPEAGDPLAKAVHAVQKPGMGLSHYTFRLRSFDGTPLAASYYPSRLGNSAPTVMLIHETGRSRKDFEDPVEELKGQGLAAHLQGLGYAVFSMDLRWQGQNPRRALTADERPKLLEDLQAGYFFLVDRHNRGDLNLEKLGVVALGDGANLVTSWAIQPGAAITIEGKPSDVSALALISPNPEGFGYILRHGLTTLAPRVPILLIAGERDNASKDAVQSVRQALQRSPAQQDRTLSVRTPRLQAPATRTQDYVYSGSLSGDNSQEPASGVGAEVQFDAHHIR